ncbi:MAG TPA: hypothetical protein VF017_10010 [Thermoanaerobaculia bacterium]|nr:hypothetical protein [Thermoanaerobaculia bacterium]
MRSAPFLRLLVVGLLLSSILSPLAAAPPAPASLLTPAAADTITLEDLFQDEQSVADDSLFPVAAWNCPAYTQICSTNSQCDAYCGGVGWGECIVYSGVMKCCACNT